MENKSLGAIIKEERQKRNITQAELGRRIGLKAARVSKIESGAPITPEVASFILGKMGSQLQISVVGADQYDEKLSDFVLMSILSFADSKQISYEAAFKYLTMFKGISFLTEQHDIEQTLGFDEIVSDLSRVCSNHGGAL